MNGITAIIDGIILKKRAFGLSGVMFVDYLSIGIVIIFVKLLVSDQKFKYLVILAFFFLLTILHQTRGVWIVLVLTLLLILIFFLYNNIFYGINKNSIVIVLISTCVLIFVSVLALTTINPKVEQRATQLQQNQQIIDNEGYIDNSLITRALIWQTAINAFKSHPIIGIGSHSFAFQSKIYSTLDPFLYKKYVQGLTPHGTFFAVLPEVGIIGFVGFLYLLISSLRHSFSAIKRSKSIEDKRNSTILFFILIYINLSMIITDAWLFGSGAILWGLVLGLMGLNQKLLPGQEEIIR